MKNLISAFILIISFSAIANEKGNGGDAIVCRNSQGKIESSELLDYYEGREFRKVSHHFHENLSDLEYFDKLGKQLTQFDERFKDLGKEAHSFVEAIEKFKRENTKRTGVYIFTDHPLADINDSLHLTFPRNCKVEQLAIRTYTNYVEGFIFNSEILRSLKPDDLRGIILHELIYKFFHQWAKAENSLGSRYFHQILTSLPLEEFTFHDYMNLQEIMNETHGSHIYNEITKGGERYSLEKFLFEQTGEIKLVRHNRVLFYLNDDGSLNKDLTEAYVMAGFSYSYSGPVCDYKLPMLITLKSRGKTHNDNLMYSGQGANVSLNFGKVVGSLKIPSFPRNHECHGRTGSIITSVRRSYGEGQDFESHILLPFTFKAQAQNLNFSFTFSKLDNFMNAVTEINN